MILDNFETPWEAMDGRTKVEEFLSLLAGIPHLALLVCPPLYLKVFLLTMTSQITMRGAERPGKVQWTHPFLRPLMPLDQAAARQTFIEIADEIHDGSEVDQLLEITDNIPLAVQLVAGIAASVGCQETMEGWKLERTALLSAGYDKRSNLDISITLSLSSPRMLSSPHAVELLSIMSLLSDGISNLDLIQSNIPIPDISDCKTTLVRTSLAYVDHTGRFKVLAPIREYIHATRPPSPQLVRPLRKYLIYLLEIYTTTYDTSTVVDLVPRLRSNLGNLHSVLQHGLGSDHTDLRESILGIIMLNGLNLNMNQGLSPLMLRLPKILSGTDDHDLQGQFITSEFDATPFYTLANPELAIEKAIEHFRLVQNDDRKGEYVNLDYFLYYKYAAARFYCAIARYYKDAAGHPQKAEHYFRLAFSLASQNNSDPGKFKPLNGLALLELGGGNYSKALRLAKETCRIGRASGNLQGELGGVRLLAVCYLFLGNFKQSLEILNEGRELVVRAGLQGGEMETFLMNIEANVYELKTEYSDARCIQEAILHQTSAVLSPAHYAHALANIASIDIVTGASADIVARNLEAARNSFQNAQYPRGLHFCDNFHADLRLREGDTMAARVEYLRLFSAARDYDRELAWHCAVKLADSTKPVHAETESARWAVIFLAFALCPRVPSPLMVHQALQHFADVLARQGADDAALNILAIALDGFTQMDVHQSRAECMRTIGDIYMRLGDLSKAQEIWEAAWPLFRRSEQKKEVTSIDERLQMLGVAQTFEALPKAELLPPQIPLQESEMKGEEKNPHLVPDL
jgi:tetratricopeptide (TPR) repeat protein